MQLIDQHLTATAGLWLAYDLLHETEFLVAIMNVSGFTQGVVAGLRLEPDRNLAVCADVELPLLGRFSSVQNRATVTTPYSIMDAGVVIPGLSLSLLFRPSSVRF